jgi:polyhydroxyalkanoate synthesis regulator phasin
MVLSAEEKKRFLKSLDEDKEFRYAVAGYLGIGEILKRLDSLEESMKKLWEEVKSLREDFNILKSDVSILKSDVSALKEDVSTLKSDVRDIRTTLDRLTLTVEDEARSVIKHRIKRDLNIDMELDRVFIDEREVNIYGAVNDICVIGEATVRLGTKLIDELLGKIELIKHERPDLLRKKIIKVIYTDYALPDAVESARNNKVWILRRKKDLTPMVIEEVG